MGGMWRYFRDILHWGPIQKPGPLQALTQGTARSMDQTREDMLYLRDQWFPARCEESMVAEHGESRGIIRYVGRHASETPEQYRARVVHAYAWHMLGGKVEGVPQILKLYGFDVAAIENMRQFNPSRWAEFQLGLKAPATQAEQQAILDNLHELIWLVNEYKPARSFFFRLYTDVFDKRPIVLSVGPKLGDGWLSFFSGVPVEDTGNQDKDTIVSFGVRHSLQSEPYSPGDVCGSFGATTWYGFLAPYLDRFVVGRSRLSDLYPRNHGFAMGSLFSILWADRATTGRCWRGYWDARRWLDYTGFDRKLLPWRMAHRAASRAQLVPGWGEVVSDHNARLGATFAAIIDNPGRLSGYVLSGHDPERRLLRLHELFIHGSGLQTPAVSPAPRPPLAGASRLSVACPAPDSVRALQARHDEAALRMDARHAPVPRDAAHSLSPLLSHALDPAPAPPAAVSSYLAPLWRGAWTEPGRTWRTQQRLSVQ